MTEQTETLVKQEEQAPESVYHIDSTPEAIDSNSWMTSYTDLFYNDTENYWEPPISRQGLADTSRANAYHCSLLKARANYVASRFIGGGGLTHRRVQFFGNNYFTFGDGAFLKIRNGFGVPVRLHPLPSMHMRRRKNGDFVILERGGKQKVYKQKDVIFLPQDDLEQQIYGVPDYLGSMQSSLLNKDATLFRRRYYKNGAHMGFIFYASDPNLSEADEKKMKETIASSKGVGNFRSMFVNIPNGKEKGIQLIPVGDIATKDEFERIKNITAQDILVGHRFPAGKGGMMPQPGSSFPDPEKVGREYDKDEIVPVCKLIMDEVNNDPEIIHRKHLHLNFDLTIGEKV
ncbi:phage portal protein [Vibrio mediterranei]|uniref:phage portal protein n=1 Tax=Vibrio mediterranei TaxID=689 RepID=UPI001EFD21F8|nr:phage portal protein [Vibrio mediterranei]MCG9664714.1 phage portal protein [Vibrio mediterranei]